MTFLKKLSIFLLIIVVSNTSCASESEELLKKALKIWITIAGIITTSNGVTLHESQARTIHNGYLSSSTHYKFQISPIHLITGISCARFGYLALTNGSYSKVKKGDPFILGWHISKIVCGLLLALKLIHQWQEYGSPDGKEFLFGLSALTAAGIAVHSGKEGLENDR